MFDFKYKDYKFNCDIGTMTPLQYIRMINMLEKFKPNRICELGSGVSTDIFNVYCAKTNSIVQSIESDMHYNTHNSILMPLIGRTNLLIGDYSYDNCTLYDGFENWLSNQYKFDFILIDGPNDVIPFNHHNSLYSRVQLLDFPIFDKLNDECVVMYHDSERAESQNTLNEFEQLLYKNGFSYSKEIIIEDDVEIVEYNKDTLGVCPELTIYKIKKYGNTVI